jgi:dTDP-glucose 4,6-dehydratase
MTQSKQTLLITGGAGFIGSTLVRQCLSAGYTVVTFDKLTYAGHRQSLAEVLDQPTHTLVVGDIADAKRISAVFEKHRPQAVIHLAAESHVDRSIAGPPQFATTNVLGTCVLLDVTTRYWQGLAAESRAAFRFLNVSTDEVFGSATTGEYFTEHSLLAPNSPYAASKAAGEHFARAFAHTYGLPVLTVNPSNNYGPRQHPEKFIPKMILAALRGEPLGVYGDGLNERDWIHVDDCCGALLTILLAGVPGERYLIGANTCVANIRVAEMICDCVDELIRDGARRRDLITHVVDRPGHDRRYALDADYLKSQTAWRPIKDFCSGLRETVSWYLENLTWAATVSRSGV